MKKRTLLLIIISLLSLLAETSADESPVGTWTGTMGSGGAISACINYPDGSSYMCWSMPIGGGVTVSSCAWGTYTYSEGVYEAEYSGTATEDGHGTSTTYTLDIYDGNNVCDHSWGNYYIDFDPQTDWPDSNSGSWDATRISLPEMIINPSPPNDAIGQPADITLTWSNNGGCDFDVYFGTDYNDVSSANTIHPLGVYQGNYYEREYQASSLSYCTTYYYWRIDNRNNIGTTKGDVWRFSTLADINAIVPVNFEDLELFALYWLDNTCDECGWCECMDLDQSGDVSFFDFAILACHWLLDESSIDANLIGHWTLDDNAADTIVLDSSGLDYHGTAQRNTSAIHADSGNPPFLNGSFIFNGSSDYVTIPKESDLITGTNDFTIAGWFNLNTVSPTQNMLCWKEPSSAIQFIIRNGAGNIGIWAGSKMLMNIAYTFTTGTWYHIAWTRNGNTWRVYVDGTQIGPDVIDSCSLGTPTLNYHIGAEATAPSQFFSGKMDDIRIYDRALSETEIANLCN